MSDCGCGETLPTASACQDAATGLTINPTKLCDERFLSLPSIPSNVTLTGLVCDPKGRCLVKLGPNTGQVCDNFVVIGKYGCVRSEPSPNISGMTEANTGDFATGKITRLFAGYDTNGDNTCHKLVSFHNDGLDPANPNQVIYWDPDINGWMMGSINFALSEFVAAITTDPVGFLGWHAMDWPNQEGDYPVWFYHNPGLLINDANHLIDTFNYTAGVLWNDGTDPYWAAIAGHAGEFLRVNSTATGVEWAAQGDQLGYIDAFEFIGVPTGWTDNGTISNGEVIAPDDSVGGVMVEGARYKITYYCEAFSPHFRIYPSIVTAPKTVGASTMEYEANMRPANDNNTANDTTFLYGVSVTKVIDYTAAFELKLAFNDTGFEDPLGSPLAPPAGYFGGGRPIRWGMIVERIA